MENGPIARTASRSASASAASALSGIVRVRPPFRCRSREAVCPGSGRDSGPAANAAALGSSLTIALPLIQHRGQDAPDNLVGEAARFRKLARERF